MGGPVAPRVSVVVPGRDCSAYLGDALCSLAGQFGDPRALEVIYVDDGSLDGSAELAESHAGEIPGLVVLRNRQPAGVSAARNRGLAAARGRLLGFLDADDWLAPGQVPVLADALDRLGCDFVRTDVVHVTGRGRTLVRAPESRRGRVLAPRESILPVTANSMVDHPTVAAGLYRRELWECGLLRFDEDLPSAEDRHLMWRLHLAADSFAVLGSPGVCYRRGVGGSLTQADDGRRLGYLVAYQRIWTMVEHDPDAPALAAKLVQTVLALTAQHLSRAEGLSAETRTRMVSGAAELLARFPAEVCRPLVTGLDGARRDVLSGVLAGLPREWR